MTINQQVLRTIHSDAILAERYRIAELLGSGNMGEVYKAVDLERERFVALKRIHPHLIADKDAIQRFQREAKALSRLNHPGIVKFHDFYVEDGVYFIVLNYLDGETLEERCRKIKQTGRHFPLEEVQTIALQLCDALTYAHQRHVIHRDLKPANVMISSQGHAIIMDFGIAKLLDGDNLTGDGLSPGTPGYMSPELIRGRAVDARSDIYTLGIILYELVAGQRPFQGNSRYDTLHCHLFDTAPDVRQFNPQAPDTLAHLIAQALAKEPEGRPQTAEMLAQALRQVEINPAREERPFVLPVTTEADAPTPATSFLPRPDFPVNNSSPQTDPRPQPTPLQSASTTAQETMRPRTFRQRFSLGLLILLVFTLGTWGLTRALWPTTGPETSTTVPTSSPLFTQPDGRGLAPILSADETPTIIVTAAADVITPTLAATLTPTPSTTRPLTTATATTSSQPSSPNTPGLTPSVPLPTVVTTSAPLPTSAATIIPTVAPTKTSPPSFPTFTPAPLPSLTPAATAKPDTERTPTRKNDDDK